MERCPGLQPCQQAVNIFLFLVQTMDLKCSVRTGGWTMVQALQRKAVFSDGTADAGERNLVSLVRYTSYLKLEGKESTERN